MRPPLRRMKRARLRPGPVIAVHVGPCLFLGAWRRRGGNVVRNEGAARKKKKMYTIFLLFSCPFFRHHLHFSLIEYSFLFLFLSLFALLSHMPPKRRVVRHRYGETWPNK